MWVCRGLAELVVDAVVPRPDEDGVLHGEAVDQHEEDAEGQPRLVRAVRPQPVRARRHALQQELASNKALTNSWDIG